MRLTFGGDFAWPSTTCIDTSSLKAALTDEQLVLNLEGALLSGDACDRGVANQFKFNLFSCEEALTELKRMNVVAVGLANNHISDYLGGCRDTAVLLDANGIPYFGLGNRRYVDMSLDTGPLRLVAFASPLTEIGSDEAGMTACSFDPRQLLSDIRTWRRADPQRTIVVFAHWGYELSEYPLPADREWAIDAIAAGASYVIGHHPHVVQGIEKVEGGVIAYSLGNFVLPQTNYRERQLSYQDSRVNAQIALTIEEDPIVRWFSYSPERQSVDFECMEHLSSSARIQALTPFSGMSSERYRDWYRHGIATREIRRKRGEPVVWSYRGSGHYYSAAVNKFLAAKRLLRKLLIASGLHRPYNWKSPA